MNLFSFLLLFALLTGQYLWVGPTSYLASGFAFFTRHPEILPYIGAFALSGSIAQVFIFGCLEEYGGFQTTAICTARKILSVLISVFFFKHRLDFVQYIGMANVFLGLALQVHCGSGFDLTFQPSARKAHHDKKA